MMIKCPRCHQETQIPRAADKDRPGEIDQESHSYRIISTGSVRAARIVWERTVPIPNFLFTEIPYLWFLVIGCIVLITLAHLMNPLFVSNNRNRA